MLCRAIHLPTHFSPGSHAIRREILASREMLKSLKACASHMNADYHKVKAKPLLHRRCCQGTEGAGEVLVVVRVEENAG